MPERVRYPRGSSQPVRYTPPKAQGVTQEDLNNRARLLQYQQQGYYIAPGVQNTGYNPAYDVNRWRTNFPAGMPQNLPAAAYMQPYQYGFAQPASMFAPRQSAPTPGSTWLPAQAYMTPQQWGGVPQGLNSAANQLATNNPAQSQARAVAQLPKQAGWVKGPQPVWLPEQAFLTEEQWGGPQTIPWNYPTPPEQTPAPGGGGGGYYGGGYGGGGSYTATVPTPDISRWLAGLISWRT